MFPEVIKQRRIKLIRIDHVSKSFGELSVLDDISFSVEKGEIICVLGPSGCGKSTLLNILAGLSDPDEGEIVRESEKVGYVFQEDRLLPWKSVYDNISLVSPENPKAFVLSIIEKIGLKGFEDSYPNSLSGGMKQRCSIARAFNYNSDLLLMDEPFKSLDYMLSLKMIKELILLWENRKNSIIFVTHDIDEALLLGDKIVLLTDRPTKIKKVFAIDVRKTERNLGLEKLVAIRNEIINEII